MAKSGLEKYNARVKQIKKSGKTHKQAQRQASSEVRGHKVSGVGKKRKKAVGKSKGRVGTKPKYKVIHEVRKIGAVSYTGGKVSIGGTARIEEQRKRLAEMIGQQIGWLEVAISSAKTEREKKALRGKKNRLTAQLRKINNHG